VDLTRIDPPSNARRFYRMEIVPGLFGDWSLVREWGRIGQSGQVRVDWFETEVAAKDARFTLHMQKAKRGTSRLAGQGRYDWPFELYWLLWIEVGDLG